MMRSVSLLALSGAALCLLAACAGDPSKNEGSSRKEEPTWEQASANLLVPANYKAADFLLAQAGPHLGKNPPLIMATVVDIDALDRSSTLGRLISEQVSGRFTQAGHRMLEMKFGNAVYVRRDQGELMLTREIDRLARNHEAQAVIVGTYGQSSSYVFVNLKVIQPETNVVLAVHDYVLPQDASIRSLLRSR